MKLRELNASFITMNPDGTIQMHEDIKSADGLRFLCPKCFTQNKGPAGTHEVWCWFSGKVGDEVVPKPGRWNPQGTSIDDITFVEPGAVSVLLIGGCAWHGFVRNGDAQ